jgi:outer membrane lipoprotein-sorting protein
MITVLAAGLVLLPVQTPSINDLVQPRFEDASFRVKLLFAKQSELKKISNDFGTSYTFKTMDVKLKEPFKVYLKGKVEDTEVVYILNGTDRVMSVPKIRLHQKEKLDDEPGKRQTSLDFGFMTPSLFKGLFVAEFVRTDRATGNYVFDIRYDPKFNYKTYYRVWIDPQKHYITKREWYRKDRQLATFFYSEPVNQGGIWLPTRLVVKNVDNVRAGETAYEAMQVNTGLSDELFKIK